MTRVIVTQLFPGIELVDTLPCETCSCYPIAPVGTWVVVKQKLLEMGCAPSPIHAKIKDKVACHILASAVAHETSGFQLTHAGIHQGIPSSSVFPPLQRGL
eukprot:CAMPEP_0172920474 /NCGR_PEP_ID=MMETSP1075-20121228/204174_1 /TAXON_ID=2916 /ORGANISM="Ceratium fusus, Strain PA161109" /LENGTH=100 /DNA_ID=CAMNT_0013780509 /DNA_START=213 /DNA_END=515 /DNA_ORIENTATION=+